MGSYRETVSAEGRQRDDPFHSQLQIECRSIANSSWWAQVIVFEEFAGSKSSIADCRVSCNKKGREKPIFRE